ncbi:hypothetical protein F5B20DRAFT_564693 [Whalleya microplaca]|nr:hypothetical protein F5B20DRAFT_564693 [Whalleya microplaca]
MAGRRRRAASTSTVATVDEATTVYYKESTVLKPVSSRIHPDDWPCFLLADAIVYHRDGTLANLLHVDLEGPFIVRGRVEIEKDQDRFLVNRQGKTRTQYIQIENTVSFSIGLKDEGLPMPVLWASGEAGWYEIVPSDRYKTTCDIMFQGISLHYAVLDQYEEALDKLHKKKKNRSKTIQDVKLDLDDVLFRYAVTVGDAITLPEAYQRCTDQAIFILSHFPKGTQFHDWIAGRLPELVQKLAKKSSKDQKTANSEPSPLVAALHPPLGKSSSLEAVDAKTRGKSSSSSIPRSTRNGGKTDAEVIELSSDEELNRAKPIKNKRRSPREYKSESADVVMHDASDEMPHSSRATRRNAPRVESTTLQPSLPESTQSRTSSNPGINPPVAALLDILGDIRKEILQSVREGKQKKHPDDITPKSWHTKLYLECSIKEYKGAGEICQYYARDLLRLLDPEWHQSQFYEWLKENRNIKPKFEKITEQDVKTIVRRQKNPQSISRGAAVENKQPSTDRAGKQPQRGRPSGKAAGLRPSLGSKKRLRQEFDSEEDEEDLDEDQAMKRTTKRSRYFTDEEHDEAHDTASSLDGGEQAEKTNGPLTRVVIRSEKVPSMVPKGPNKTWTCEEPDCGYVVRAADQEEGQKLISEHYEAHEKDAQDEAEQAALSRVNLALKESQGFMPINHLLEKIRGRGEKVQKRNEVRLNGEVLPQPIKRTLLT